MAGRREHSRHPDECRCKCHQPNGQSALPPQYCDCCWTCPYCRLPIKKKIAADSHRNRCTHLINAKSSGLDPNICTVREPAHHRDHPAGCCKPCAKCGRYITDNAELLADHLAQYCPINCPSSDDDAA